MLTFMIVDNLFGYNCGAYFVSNNLMPLIKEAIESKNNDVISYKEKDKVSETWLLLHISGSRSDQAFEYKKEDFDKEVFRSNFNKVFLFDTSSGFLEELKTIKNG